MTFVNKLQTAEIQVIISNLEPENMKAQLTSCINHIQQK